MKKMILMGHALILTLAFAMTGSVAAASPCKGLSESECSSNDKCTWVSGYSQKDGDKVKAYCRAKPGQAGGDSEKKSKKKKEKSDEAMKSDENKSDAPEKKEKKSKKKKEDKADSKEDKKDDSKKKKKSKKKKDN